MRTAKDITTLISNYNTIEKQLITLKSNSPTIDGMSIKEGIDEVTYIYKDIIGDDCFNDITQSTISVLTKHLVQIRNILFNEHNIKIDEL